ncbi:MAG: hypothetical protein KGL39_15245 [Patescibacteria group bacterium]|nr:hypothetical protein [Patescibacteria group bacterium]
MTTENTTQNSGENISAATEREEWLVADFVEAYEWGAVTEQLLDGRQRGDRVKTPDAASTPAPERAREVIGELLYETPRSAAKKRVVSAATDQSYTLTPHEREVIARHERRLVCSWCGEDFEGDPKDSASDCCSCDLVPASHLPSLLREARREAQEAVDALPE